MREEAKPRRPKSRPGPAPTLAETAAHTTWLLIYCEALGCHHSAPIEIALLIARFGEDATNDRFQRLLRCSKCGAHDTSFRLPSWINSRIGTGLGESRSVSRRLDPVGHSPTS